MKKFLLLPLAATLAALSCNTSFAAVIASDNAANYSSGGWSIGNSPNLGTGFGSWFLWDNAGPGAKGCFLGDSTATVGANINTGGTSFGMYGESPSWTEANAYRFFNGDLSAGQTFSIDLAVNYRNGGKGIDLRSSGGATLFNFNVAADDYTVNGTTLGTAYSNITAFHLAVTQTDGSGGAWTLTRTGGVSAAFNGTYSGIAQNVKLYIFNTDAGSANNLMFNNLSIVPEPATIGMLLGGAGLLVFVRRRRS